MPSASLALFPSSSSSRAASWSWLETSLLSTTFLTTPKPPGRLLISYWRDVITSSAHHSLSCFLLAVPNLQPNPRNSTVPNQTGGVFWAVVNQLLIITQVVILILSECGWPMSAFDRFFPVLGSAFGLGPLGVFECLIGATILSHFVDDFTLVAAFFLFSLGCLNILLGLIFGVKAKQKRSIRAWRSDSDDVFSSFGKKPPTFAHPGNAYMKSLFLSEEIHQPASSGLGFSNSAEKVTSLRGIPHTSFHPSGAS